MGKDAEKVFRELKDDVSTYAELKLELIKLNAYERISKVIAILSYGLLLSALAFTAILFAMLTLGFLLSKWLDSTTAGFGIVAGLYLILVVLVIFYKNRICLKVINIMVSALNSNDQKKDATTNSEPEDDKSEQTSDTD
ncbi:MAG: phage holin family protein [Tannerella sp.]|jgi:hypothetical protein|nr:phage holin family protein [Tannerella sp.]